MAGIFSYSQRKTRIPFLKFDHLFKVLFLFSLLVSSLIISGFIFEQSKAFKEGNTTDDGLVSTSVEIVIDDVKNNYGEKQYSKVRNKEVKITPIDFAPQNFEDSVIEKNALRTEIGGIFVQ